MESKGLGFNLYDVINALTFLGVTGLDSLTHSCVRVPLEIVIWIYDTLYHNFSIKYDFTNYFQLDVF